MNIVPLVGLKNIEFGDSKEKANELFGTSDLIKNELGQDGVSSEIWEYQSKGIELHFDPDLEFRLWDISVTSENAKLNSVKPIGFNESELLTHFPSLVLEVNDGIFKEYVDPSNELVFFLRNNVVKRIDISPNLDDYLKRFGGIGNYKPFKKDF
ncbi:MAG: hypothetical protein HRT53_21770 [Colwellia sp.]|nr:hypothetical protein [Colwellia sp.]